MNGDLCESIARVFRNMLNYKLMSGNSMCWSATFCLNRFCGQCRYVVTALISVVLRKVCVGVVAIVYGRWSFCWRVACVLGISGNVSLISGKLIVVWRRFMRFC